MLLINTTYKRFVLNAYIQQVQNFFSEIFNCINLYWEPLDAFVFYLSLVLQSLWLALQGYPEIGAMQTAQQASLKLL